MFPILVMSVGCEDFMLEETGHDRGKQFPTQGNPSNSRRESQDSEGLLCPLGCPPKCCLSRLLGSLFLRREEGLSSKLREATSRPTHPNLQPLP